MPRVAFDPTTQAFERAKTVNALDRAAAMIGNCYVLIIIFRLMRLAWSNDRTVGIMSTGARKQLMLRETFHQFLDRGEQNENS